MAQTGSPDSPGYIPPGETTRHRYPLAPVAINTTLGWQGKLSEVDVYTAQERSQQVKPHVGKTGSPDTLVLWQFPDSKPHISLFL